MRIVRCRCLSLAVLAGLAVVPRMAFAQTGSLSDLLAEIVLDHNAPVGADDVPLTPPAVSYPIPEGSVVEPGGVFPFPGREIDFREVGPTGSQFSDRLSISQYQVGVVSDDNPNGLPRRPNATPIPASALENFLPFSIIAGSDGNVPGTANHESDHLLITLGYYGPGTGIKDFDETIVEPLPEGVTEPVLLHVIAPIMFDVFEPPVEVGGTVGIVSDYVDILTPIEVRFISTDDPAVIGNLLPANGFVLENFETGGGVSYALGFHSDAVPEPGSFVLLGTGLLFLGWIGRGRSVRTWQRS